MNSLFSNINLTNSNFNVNTDYVYNFYDETEAIRDDAIIELTNNNSSSYCQIELKCKSLYSNNLLFKFFDNFNLDTIKSFSLLKDLREERKFFNFPFDKNKISINYKIKEDHVSKIKKEFKVTNNSGNEAFESILSNKSVNISKKYTKSFIEANEYSNIYFSQENKNKLNFVDSFENFEESKKLELLSSFKKIYSKSSYNVDINEAINVGFLIEKYNKEKLLASRFIFNNKIEDNNYEFKSMHEPLRLQNIEFQKIIRDKAVQYGKNYSYLVYPVYLINLPSKQDYHMSDFYLICSSPSVSKKILCEEKNRPLYPESLRIKYNTKNSAYITWNQPEEIQSDIKGYQIFKRHDLMSPFRLIGQIESHHNTDIYTRNVNISNSIVESQPNNLTNFFYDKNFDQSKINIYTICSIDAHGNISNYSVQIGVKLNHISKKLVFDTVSIAGAPLQYPNLLIKRKTKFFDNDNNIVTITPAESNCKKLTLFYTPEYESVIRDEEETKIIKEDYSFSIYKIESDSYFVDQIKINIPLK